LTIKQRKFVRALIETGSGGEAAMRSYNCTNRNSARAVASETLANPNVRLAFEALLEANGLSNRKLRFIHAQHLAKFASANPTEQALSLKAVDMGYRVSGAYRAARERVVQDIADPFHGWTAEELDHFATTGTWPPRLYTPDRVRRPLTHVGVEPAAPASRAAATEPVVWAPGRGPRQVTGRRPADPDDAEQDDDPEDDPEPDAAAAPSAPSLPARREETPSTLVSGPTTRGAEHAREEVARLERQLRDAKEPVLDPMLREMATRDRRW
jgi:hypothetical protein